MNWDPLASPQNQAEGPPPEVAPASSFDAVRFENLLAGRWLNIAGLLLVFLGTAFFLKVAFDHDWIAPVYRVTLGVLAGAVMIAYAQRLTAAGNRYFAEGITALGCGIEFLSMYASTALFHLVSPEIALLGMVAVNAVLAALAWRHNSVRLAILAAVGGFASPVLAGTNADPWLLAGYLTILSAGLMLLDELLDSRIVAPMAVTGTLAYALLVFFPSNALSEGQHAIVYGLLYLPFAFSGWNAARLRSTLDPVRSAVSSLALLGLIAGLESALAGSDRSALAGALVALAAAHLAAAAFCKSRLHAWFAAAALTPAIPAAFDGAAIDVAWAIEAAVLAIAGRRTDDPVLRIAGISLLGADLLNMLARFEGQAVAVPVFNARFAAETSAFIAAFAIAYDTQRNGFSTLDIEIARVMRILAHVLAFTAVSTETWDAVAYFGGSVQGSNAALSVAWAIFATSFIATGLLKRDALLRWEGLGLLTATAAKVLLFDLSYLDLSYRVISFVLVGAALIGISYVYQRRLAAVKEEQP
jgi:uncharacterized membrane protein